MLYSLEEEHRVPWGWFQNEYGTHFPTVNDLDPIEADFILSLKDDPANTMTLLVYADWLEEQGSPVADMIRKKWRPRSNAIHERWLTYLFCCNPLRVWFGTYQIWVLYRDDYAGFRSSFPAAFMDVTIRKSHYDQSYKVFCNGSVTAFTCMERALQYGRYELFNEVTVNGSYPATGHELI